MRKIKTFIFLSLLIIISCKQDKTRGNDIEKLKTATVLELPYFIDIEGNLKKKESVQVSSIGKELEYILLETNPNSLMGEIGDIKFSSDFIFVNTNNPSRVLQFDRQGNFIRQVGSSGRGPGEYNGVSALCIDEKNEKVYTFGWWPHNLLEFNFNGSFIRSIVAHVPFNSYRFLVYDTVGLAFYIYNDLDILSDSMYSPYNLYITDFDFNLLYKIKRHMIRKGNVSPSYIPIYFFANELRFKQYAVDTLYTLKKMRPEPYAIYNLGKNKMNPNLVVIQSEKNEFLERIINNIEVRETVENNKFLFTKIGYGLTDLSIFCIFNKQTSETTILSGNGLTNDIDGGIPFWPKFVYNDSILIDYCSAATFLDHMHNLNSEDLRERYGDDYTRLENLTTELDEMSNPVLIILKP